MFQVILDEKQSYLTLVEDGMEFNEAVNHIISYCQESGYQDQAEYWKEYL